MAKQRNSYFFALRVAVLLFLLGGALIAYRYVERIGGPEQLIPELLRVHQEREAREDADLAVFVGNAVAALESTSATSNRQRISAAHELAEEGLARRKT